MLIVDIGNSYTRLVVFDGAVIKDRRSFPTAELTASELAPVLAELATLTGARTAWVASVRPAANAVVDSAAARAGLGLRFIRPGVDKIIPHRLTTPETTGADRLLSALAAGALHVRHDRGRQGYIVIQCGSAATVDVVDASGIFSGGYILPGPGFWLSGLSGAAQLPDLTRELPDWTGICPGDNTRDAIMHGMAAALPVAVASAAMLINTDSSCRQALAGDLPVIVTGGWGEVVTGFLNIPNVYDEDLLLHGIRIFAERAGG